MTRHHRRRTGFTLVEMLVVLFIIVLLATLAVAIVPKISQESRAARGADQLQGSLFNAKMRAKSAGHPVGLRLQVPILATATQAFRPVPPPPGQSVPATVMATATSGTLPDSGGIFWAITPGSWVLVADDNRGLNSELVQVASVSGNSFIANFAIPHPMGAVIRPMQFVTTLQYIEQPDDYVVTGWPLNPSVPGVRRLSLFNPPTPPYPPGTLLALLEPWPPGTIEGVEPDFTGGVDPTQPDQWAVQPGDYLELFGGGQVHYIQSVNQYTIPNLPALFPNPPFPSNNPPSGPMPPLPVFPNQSYYGLLQLAPATVNPTSAVGTTQYPGTSQYRIIRAPRVLRGEPDMLMPQAVAIDISTNFIFGNQLPIDPQTGTIDILFAPTGSVVGRAPSGGSIILWVRDATQGDNNPHPLNDPLNPIYLGQPSLVATQVRTGFIASHMVYINGALNYPNPPAAQNTPYRFTLDGLSSGM
jgi:prepilin-type N-terminal cleavage/methylation domain-containing protein